MHVLLVLAVQPTHLQCIRLVACAPAHAGVCGEQQHVSGAGSSSRRQQQAKQGRRQANTNRR